MYIVETKWIVWNRWPTFTLAMEEESKKDRKKKEMDMIYVPLERKGTTSEIVHSIHATRI
jgi:hypothetical protein